ncbi:MAG: flagellin [Campylobacterota bacterium]|nr:flagellin [Campylobacterota bacterium]
MGFLKINTNIASMNAHLNSVQVNRALDSSLEKLSSGLRINKAADDSSGMAIADSLRLQADSLGQAIRNANDAIGIIQIADKAMDEQIKILNTIKTKATQAAQDGQSRQSREAIQRDINKLIEQLDNIAIQTSFNGQKLLAGTFTNKEFQIGAFSNETVKASIGATTSDKIGGTRFETTATVTASSNTVLTFRNPNGGADIELESTTISTSVGTGLGALARSINKASDSIGVRAVANVQTTGSAAVQENASIKGLEINGVLVGDIDNVKANDANGNIVNSINSFTIQTGVRASIDVQGRLNLTSVDGRGIQTNTISTSGVGIANFSAGENYGRLTLIHSNSRDIVFSATGSLTTVINSGGTQSYANLANVGGNFTAEQGLAAGAFANSVISSEAGDLLGTGVSTKTGAMMTMDIADAATNLLDSIRADLGAAQNQLTVTINNISVTRVNVQSAESQIREVDFAVESANFSKNNILAQSGSFALAQANKVQNNVLQLLQ